MRDIERPFDDAYVEFFARIDGEGAVPYLPPEMLGLSDYAPDCTPSANTQRTQTIMRYGWAWFASKDTLPNYLQIIGVACPPVISCKSAYDYTGITPSPLSTPLSLVSPCVPINNNPSFVKEIVSDAICHELGHQFSVNQCVSTDSGHDNYDAWCGNCGGSQTEKCLMNETRNYEDGIIRFGVLPLVGPRSECPDNEEAAIRTHTDPLR